MRLKDTRNINDIRALACKRLPRPILDYLEGGADDEVSLRRNLSVFDDYCLMPEMLVDVSEIDTSTKLLGLDISMPVMLSPTGSSCLFHTAGETAVAKAADRAGTFYSLSTMANTSLEDIAKVGDGPKIFQLYVFKDREFTKALVERCRANGYHALCLTVDAAVGGNRERDALSGMTMPPSLTLKSMMSFATHPTWSLNALFRLKFKFPNFDSPSKAIETLSAADLFNTYFDRSVSWADAEWLAGIWGGPLIIKGLLSTDDVKRAQSIGATAVMLSNHGGRQLDATPSPMDTLSEIRDAVGDELELIVDGGVRRGTDVLKALAAGANACSIGRPYLYGLAAAGEKGVDRSISLLKSEIERGMTLMGTPSISDIRAKHLHKKK